MSVECEIEKTQLQTHCLYLPGNNLNTGSIDGRSKFFRKVCLSLDEGHHEAGHRPAAHLPCASFPAQRNDQDNYAR